MKTRIIFFVMVFCTLLKAQELTVRLDKTVKSEFSQELFAHPGPIDYSVNEAPAYFENNNDFLSLGKKPEKQDIVLKAGMNDLSNSKLKPIDFTFKEVDLKLDYKMDDLFLVRENPAQMSKLEKFGISQLVFAGMGVIDYSIKEAPMYPNHRPDSFFWQTGWAGITYATSFSVNLMLVKDIKYLLGALTEDMSYFLCRKLFHKEGFPDNFGLPFRILGVDNVPMNTMVIIWAASVTYLLLDSLDIL